MSLRNGVQEVNRNLKWAFVVTTFLGCSVRSRDWGSVSFDSPRKNPALANRKRFKRAGLPPRGGRGGVYLTQLASLS